MEMGRHDFDVDSVDFGGDDEYPDEPIIEDVEDDEENQPYNEEKRKELEKIKMLPKWAQPLEVGSKTLPDEGCLQRSAVP